MKAPEASHSTAAGSSAEQLELLLKLTGAAGLNRKVAGVVGAGSQLVNQ